MEDLRHHQHPTSQHPIHTGQHPPHTNQHPTHGAHPSGQMTYGYHPPVTPPGLEAIYRACKKLYPEQPNPLQVAAIVKYWYVLFAFCYENNVEQCIFLIYLALCVINNLL